jgi:hypothetical protein
MFLPKDEIDGTHSGSKALGKELKLVSWTTKEGLSLGNFEGSELGPDDDIELDPKVGEFDGTIEGLSVGNSEGREEGLDDGFLDGKIVGFELGTREILPLGNMVNFSFVITIFVSLYKQYTLVSH